MDWGSFAEWVSGIGTVGALLLGLNILRRDHANAEKSQIDQVGWWYGPDRIRYGWIIANYSLLPVHIIIEPADNAGPSSPKARTQAPVQPSKWFHQHHPACAPTDWSPSPPVSKRVFFDGEDTNLEGGSRNMIKLMVVIDNAGRAWTHKFGKGWQPASGRARMMFDPRTKEV